MFRTPYNFILCASDCESDHGPSLTVPDQSLTVREIFERFAVGAPLDIVDRGSDRGDDEDFADYDSTFEGHNDLVDVYESALLLEEGRQRRVDVASAKAAEEKRIADEKVAADMQRLADLEHIFDKKIKNV